MKLAVIGGGLQGIEAIYLAKKAGWQVSLLDKNPAAPAGALADKFLTLDVCYKEGLYRALRGVDLVLPALENEVALFNLERWCKASGIPLAFDPGAYAVSSSKTESDHLFALLSLPVPRSWPESPFPVFAKPDKSSGSRGVKVLRNVDEFKAHFPNPRNTLDWVWQEYLSGPSYSLEIIGTPGGYRTLQVTDLAMDAYYDCKRVTAPSLMPAHLVSDFESLSLKIASALDLKGIMDVEVILHDDKLKLLEIDARLPSQTPITVFWSTGFNMVQALGKVFLGEEKTEDDPGDFNRGRGVVLEHIRVSECFLEVKGEGIMKNAEPLHLVEDFFGAPEALTDYEPGKSQWVATMIFAGDNLQDAFTQREEVIGRIKDRFDLSLYMDSEPVHPLFEEQA